MAGPLPPLNLASQSGSSSGPVDVFVGGFTPPPYPFQAQASRDPVKLGLLALLALVVWSLLRRKK